MRREREIQPTTTGLIRLPLPALQSNATGSFAFDDCGLGCMALASHLATSLSRGFTSPQAVRGCCCSYVVARPRQYKLNQLGLTHFQGRVPAQSALADPLLALLSLFRHRFQNSCSPKQHHTPFDQIDLEYGTPRSPCRRRRQEAEFFSIETAPGKGGVCYGRIPTPIRRTSSCSHPAPLVRFPFALRTQTPFINLSRTLWLNRIDSAAGTFYCLESSFIRHFMVSRSGHLHAGSPLCVSCIILSKPLVVVMLTNWTYTGQGLIPINPLLTNVVNSWIACTCTWLYVDKLLQVQGIRFQRVLTHAEIESV